MPCFHVRYTPYALGTDVKGWLMDMSKTYNAMKYCAHEEDKGRGDQSSLHYHVYLELECVTKTIKNRLREFFKIPSGVRGMENTYYMAKEIKMDLITFTLGYIQDDEKLIATNMDPTELNEALLHYRATRKTKDEAVVPSSVEHRSTASAPCIEDQYLEYLKFMKEQVKSNLIVRKPNITTYKDPIDMKWVNKKTKAFYGNKGIGLFPVGTTFRRFTASFYYEFLTKMDNHTHSSEEEFAKIGY